MPFDATPVRQDNEVSRLIEEARKQISDPSRWWQASRPARIGSRPHAACMGMALNDASLRLLANHDVNMEAHVVLERAVRRYGYRTIPGMNDSPTTTHEDVMRVMREAAALACVEPAKE